MAETSPKGSYEQKWSTQFVNQVTEEQEIHIFVKQMLVNRLFLGHYQERRYVDLLKSYRDVVVVNSSETDLRKDLDTVKKRLQRYYSTSTVWIGLTGPNVIGAPFGHAVWVKFHNLPFGSYWFQIKQVKFSESNEICLRLKCIRPVDSEVRSDRNPGLQQQESKKEPESSEALTHREVPVLHNIQNWKFIKIDSLLTSCSSVITMHNAKEVLWFSSVFIVACVTGFFHILQYVGDFTLKLIRELSVFLQVTTPILLGVIDFFTKCVGGLYILIGMMWRGTPANFPPQAAVHPTARYGPLPIEPGYSRFQKPNRYRY